MLAWHIYTGSGTSHTKIRDLTPEDRPPWRPCYEGKTGRNPWLEQPDEQQPERQRGRTYRPIGDEIEAVNTAIHLRRPLFIEGPPGVGKSSLAASVAYELRLGPVLRWPINTRTTLKDGLYRYDAVARLQDVARQAGPWYAAQPPAGEPVARPASAAAELTAYLRLGPLGTALLPWEHPRVVLIDEFDKGDLDLANDLLDILEEGTFLIPELARLNTPQNIYVPTDDGVPRSGWPICGGRVRCHAFPIILITSNGERTFPAAFLRRCIRLQMRRPDEQSLRRIVTAHFSDDEAVLRQIDDLVQLFFSDGEQNQLSTDQLLNAVYLRVRGLLPEAEERESLRSWIRARVFQPLGNLPL